MFTRESEERIFFLPRPVSFVCPTVIYITVTRQEKKGCEADEEMCGGGWVNVTIQEDRCVGDITTSFVRVKTRTEATTDS